MRIVWQSGPAGDWRSLGVPPGRRSDPSGDAQRCPKNSGRVQAHIAGTLYLPTSGGWWARNFPSLRLAASSPAAIGYFDSLLADRFSRHVSLMVMGHASRLDLASYEDPHFHDKLERARVQATDRIAMIQAIGAVGQQILAAVSLALGILWFSPWLLVMLVAAVVPAFLGESHFAFIGYSQNIRQTPIRRQLDYLRVVGASKESAKELRLFGLSSFLSGEYARLANAIYDQNARLARRRLWAGAALALLGTAGYYGAYAYVIYRTVTGALTWGTLQFLAGAIAGTSTNIQSVFSTFSSIADQSLFLTDLVEFLQVQPKIRSKPDAIPRRAPSAMAFSSSRSLSDIRAVRAASWTASICASTRESASPSSARTEKARQH